MFAHIQYMPPSEEIEESKLLKGIEKTLRETASVKGGVPSWIGFSQGSLWNVRGSPWLEVKSHSLLNRTLPKAHSRSFDPRTSIDIPPRQSKWSLRDQTYTKKLYTTHYAYVRPLCPLYAPLHFSHHHSHMGASSISHDLSPFPLVLSAVPTSHSSGPGLPSARRIACMDSFSSPVWPVRQKQNRQGYQSCMIALSRHMLFEIGCRAIQRLFCQSCWHS